MPFILDTGSPAGQLYAALVGQPHASVAQLSARTGLPTPAVRLALKQLDAAQLVHRTGTERAVTWEAEPPDGPATIALDAEQSRLDAARAAARQLARTYWLARRGDATYPGLEVIRDRELVVDHHRQLIAEAKDQVRGLQRPPYAAQPDQAAAAIQLQADQLARGVKHRVIYHESVFTGDAYIADAALRIIEAGEEARVLPGLPMKMVLADDQRALLPLDPSGMADGATLLVHPSALLTALIDLFEVLWRISLPIATHAPAIAEQALSEIHRTILTLLATGGTDETIARRLGVSSRTVARHCADLFERLGVTTRFQAGLRAAQLGIIQPPEEQHA